MSYVFSLFGFLLVLQGALGDTPANCSYADIQGRWTVYETQRGNTNSLTGCETTEKYITKKDFTLAFPNVATDHFGNRGFWTLIYNQGFEIVVAGRKYFMFSKYGNTSSICDQTEAGWSHTVNGMDWACVKGIKYNGQLDMSLSEGLMQSVLYKDNQKRFNKNSNVDKGQLYRPNYEFIKALNSAQNSWTAAHYKEHEVMTLEDLHKRAGGSKSKIAGIPHPMQAVLSSEEKKKLSSLPDSFDWRDVHGENFVSPVRNQGKCGSCYAFSSMGMNEARLKVMTNNTVSRVYSTQDIVECCQYSQGCEGGFPYLVGGKYAADFGLVEEQCNPYKGVDGKCTTDKTCLRDYGYNYRYVGGYYGACNEEAMKIALMSGPLAVSFEVYDDFFNYKGGVYHHVEGLEDKYNPFEITNHAVLLVGWGVDSSAGPYWTVKNSWGTSWGEDGYFRIRRGTDECSIESIAVESFPVL